MELQKNFLTIGIAILLTIFIAYGSYIFYEPPTNDCWEEYNCYKLDPCIKIDNYDSCQLQQENSTEIKECETNREECQEVYEQKMNKHSKINFFILTIIGLISIVLGVYFFKNDIISSGAIGGGILILLYSIGYTWRYWINWSKYVKFIALGLILGFLIYISYKKFSDNQSKKKN